MGQKEKCSKKQGIPRKRKKSKEFQKSQEGRSGMFLVDVSDFFNFYFCSGRGKGESEAPGEGGGVGFSLKIPGGGGGFRRGKPVPQVGESLPPRRHSPKFEPQPPLATRRFRGHHPRSNGQGMPSSEGLRHREGVCSELGTLGGGGG